MIKVQIRIIIKDGGQIPTYGSRKAAGADVYANNPSDIVLHPGQREIIPTGVYLDLPELVTEVQVRPRSGMAIKQGITVLNAPGTIDQDYQGECRVILINHDTKPQIIAKGDRIAQFVFCSTSGVFQAEFVPVDDFQSATERGAGGFGSTGK